MPLRRSPAGSLPASVLLAVLLLAPATAVGAGATSAAAALPDFVRVAQVELAGGVRHPLTMRVRGQLPNGQPLLVGSGPSGYTPAQVRAYLGLTGTGAGQTIAVVTAYDAPNIVNDLAVFNTTYGLPAPPSFRKVNQSGGTKYPVVNAGWALEAATDVQWAHAVAPQASILLVEATTSSLSNLLTAVSYAAKQSGVTVISNSYGAAEFSKQSAQDYRCKLTTAVCVFASGDTGNPAAYPATSPFALGVGGTTLKLDASGNVLSEVAWSGSGGGISAYSAKPAYQGSIPWATRRVAPDVSYAADPATGFPVYSSTPYNGQSGWFQMGGTSVGAPQWSGIIAAGNQLRRAVGKGPLAAVSSTGTPLHTRLYTSGRLADVVSGSNGTCGSVCNASVGFDGVTGLGSPTRGLDLVLRDAP